MKTQSQISKLFKKTSSSLAECTLCFKSYSCTGGCTSNLWGHLQSKHPNDSETHFLYKMKENSSNTIKDYLQKSSVISTVNLDISKIVYVDNVSLNTVTKGQTINKLFKKKYSTSKPTSPTTISKIISKNANYYKNKLTNNFIKKLKHKKITMYSDEWCDSSLRRFLVIIISDDDTFYNLGLVQIHGKATAENIFSLLKSKLHNFELDINRDIIAFVSDGCNTMIKVEKYTEIPHIMCMAHTVHLAISKSLGKDLSFGSSEHESEYDEEYQDLIAVI